MHREVIYMMIKCSECGKKFSDNAAACPHCGCPISAQKTVPIKKKTDPKEKKKVIIAAIIAVLVVGGVWLFIFIFDKVQTKRGKELMDSHLYGNGGTPITSVAKDFEDWTKNH